MPRQSAFTIIELVITLAVVAICLTLAFAILRRPTATIAAQELARIVRHARWSAVTSGNPAILLTPDHGQSIVLVPGPAWSCDPAAAGARTVVWEQHRRRLVVGWPARGVAFAPDGFPRSCLGDGVGSATATIVDGKSQAAVIVSSLGRVRWERRP